MKQISSHARITRVVIVDDCSIIRDRLASLLGELPGAEVVGYARDVETALAQVSRKQPDAVILDLNLSGGSGFDVLRRLGWGQNRPRVIVLTNHADEEYRRQARELGADVFLDKSSDFDAIMSALSDRNGDGVRTVERSVIASILGSIADTVILLRPDFVITFSSQPASPVLGYAPSEMVGHRVLNLVHEEDRSRARSALEECLRAPESIVRVELRVLARDRTWRHIEAVAVNRMSDPLIGATVVTLRDRTERHEHEMALAAATQTLNLALDASQMSLFDLDFRSSRVRLSGSWRSHVLEDTGSDQRTLAEWMTFIHPDDLGRCQAGIEDVRLRRATQFKSEFRVRRRDGSVRWIAARGDAMADSSGAVSNLRGAAIDISDLKRSEEDLKGSQGLALELIEQAPAAMLLLEAEGTIIGANARASDLLRRSKKQLLGLGIAATFPPAEHDEAQRHLRDIADRGSLVLEREVVRGDGTSIVVESTARRLPDGRIQSVMHDITARHELEARRRQAQKLEALGQLTSGISHDFNNLLTVIVSNASHLMTDLPEEHPHRAALDGIRASAWRGAQMIKRLTAFGRAEPLELQSMAPCAVLMDVIGSLQHLLPSNVTVKLDCDDPMPLIRADPVAIEQILLNLATNARDAMAQGGTFRLRATRTAGAPAWNGHVHPVSGAFIRISATDTGHGMDEATRQRVFEPFYSTKARDHGTGLGMAMVYGLMRQHQGAVTVTSSPGSGTTVDLYFPVAESA